MMGTEKKTDYNRYYRRLLNKNLKYALLYAAGIIIFCVVIGLYSKITPVVILGVVSLLLVGILYWRYSKKYYRRLQLLGVDFPAHWQEILENNAPFYANLGEEDKKVFNKRVQFFLAEKRIEAIATEIDDTIRLLVAASAIIPTFAFPFFEYPNLKQVLVYPNSFDRSFQTARFEGHEQVIAGMVGNGFMNNTLLLSKANLLAGFRGRDNGNVGIHEFVHLLDMADGAVDGLPEIFLNNAYAIPWLQVIKAEIKRIKKGQSDINPYGLTNNAEFLAVVSEYFFDNPEKMNQNHPELYKFLCTIFQQEPDKSS
jgi:Mlc titration factor MtfA (ptsG expression regulator)